MSSLELLKNEEDKDYLSNMTDAELDTEEKRLQNRRATLESEMISVNEELERISKTRFSNSKNNK